MIYENAVALEHSQQATVVSRHSVVMLFVLGFQHFKVVGLQQRQSKFPTMASLGHVTAYIYNTFQRNIKLVIL